MTGDQFAGVDIDLLADYLGGALDGTPDEAVVAALISDDPAWRSAHDALSGGMATVSASLSALPPEPMPADVATRLFESLAAAAPMPSHPADPATSDPTAAAGPATTTDPAVTGDPATTADPAVTAGPGAGTGSTDPVTRAPGDASPIDAGLATPARPHLKASEPKRHLSVVRENDLDLAEGEEETGDGSGTVTALGRRKRRLRWAAPVAAAAGILAFAGFGVSYLNSAGTSADNSTAAAGSAAREAAPLAGTYGATSEQDVTGSAAVGEIITSGINYQPSTLAEAPKRTMIAEGSSRGSAASPTARRSPQVATDQAASPLDRLWVAAALTACLNAIAAEHGAGPITVSSVDFARYQGAPAVIVRFSARDGSWAAASGPGCGASGVGSAALGRVKVG